MCIRDRPKKRQVNVVKRSNTSGPRARLDLRGKRYEEAMQELDGFIDQALLNNMAQVDIIHGIGTVSYTHLDVYKRQVKDDLIFDSWIEKVLHECIDVVNAGLALVHRCQDLDISSRDLTAKGSRGDLFDHLRDVFASGFEIRAVGFSFCEILRKLALANVSCQGDNGRIFTLAENMFQFGLRDAWDLQEIR